MPKDNSETSLNKAPQKPFGRRARFSLLGWACVLLLVLSGTVMAWLMTAHNPLGGEPYITLKLDHPKAITQAKLDPKNLRIKTSLRPEDARLASKPKKVSKKPEIKNQKKPALPKKYAENSTLKKNNDKTLRPLAMVKSLVEKTPDGLLPKINPDGLRPYSAYARKVKKLKGGAKRRARIAIVIGGMGLSVTGTKDAILRLPAEISLAFAPYAQGLATWRDKARQNGHEVMLQIPMEPFDYPDNDPGPYTLLNHLSVGDNISRLKWLMSRFTGYFGVINYMGARFTSNPDALRPILRELNNRGLAYVEDGTSARSRSQAVSSQVGIGYAKANIVIDAEHDPEAIDRNLKRLETLALERGLSIGTANGLPITIDRIVEWAKTLRSKGIVLVPVSATIKKRITQAKK